MGIRGELYSTRVILENRTYFFNVKENRMGDLYLNIVESKNKDAGGFDRQSVILFAADTQEFLKGFDESLKVLEKAVREQRRGGARKPRDGERSGDSRGDGAYDSGRERPAKKTFARGEGSSPPSGNGYTDDEGRFREYGAMSENGSYGGGGFSRDSWGRRSTHGYSGRGDSRSDSGGSRFNNGAGRSDRGRNGSSRNDGRHSDSRGSYRRQDSGSRDGHNRQGGVRRVVVRKKREKD
jgi:hypothetical protein